MSAHKAPSGRESTTRRALSRATAQVMLEEGYAAATPRYLDRFELPPGGTA